jgi:hypothetical protein
VKINATGAAKPPFEEKNMYANTCNDTFVAAQTQRSKNPLGAGRYKLDEALATIESWNDLLDVVSERIWSGDSFRHNDCLGPCMANELEEYLESIPARLAHLIGHEILPGIAALEGDGVARAKAKQLQLSAKQNAQRLVANCETARLNLGASMGREQHEVLQSINALAILLAGARALASLRQCA